MYRERNPFEGLDGWISWPPGLLTEAGLKNPERLHKGFLPPNMMNFFKFQEFCETKGTCCSQVLSVFVRLLKFAA
jgi:hypothetical protein